jgi:ATP sulfurylase
MSSVGLQNTVISGVNARITLNGVIFAVARQFTFKSGNKLEEEKVIGTDIPIINTAEFHGEMDLTVIYSTESTAQFSTMLTLSNGQIPGINFVLSTHNVQTPGFVDVTNSKTFTWTGTLWPQQMEIDQAGPQVMQAKLQGIFSARPTLGP